MHLAVEAGRRLKPLLLPLALIVAVSALLLVMDPGVRTADAERVPRVAIVQQAPQSALDQGVTGVRDALAERGFTQGSTIDMEFFNAQADMPTANDIARRVTDGSWDLVVTVSTASLLTVANANQGGRVRHVYGIVTDPTVLGVGISATDPLDHPPHMAGYGSFASIEETISLARRFNPGLKRIGLVWHTSEQNSEAYTLRARKYCAEHGIELLEANAETASNVAESAASLTSRGVEALMLTGDVLVLTAVDPLVAVADRSGIPVFSVIPPNVQRGTLFDLGADYTAIGREVGQLAANVLEGRDPATVPTENRVPEMLLLNLDVLKRIGAPWRLPKGLLESAAVIIEDGVERKQPDVHVAKGN